MNLRDHSFARELASHHADALASCAQECVIAPASYFWRQGELADAVYLIYSGRVALEISLPEQAPIQIESVENDEVLGWLWLIPSYRWHFDARAITEVRALRLEGKCLRKMCECNQLLGYQVLKAFALVTADRLQTARLRLLELFGPQFL